MLTDPYAPPSPIAPTHSKQRSAVPAAPAAGMGRLKTTYAQIARRKGGCYGVTSCSWTFVRFDLERY
jgi:hypothetical protein